MDGSIPLRGRPHPRPTFPPASAPSRPSPQPVRDAILAFLTEPRQAEAIAAHIARPVSTATGHLAAMRRRGLVVRVGWGTYARADRCPAPPHPDSITRGRPVRDRVLAGLDHDHPRTFDEIARLTGISVDRVQQHLVIVARAGLAERVGPRSYRRTGPAPETAPHATPTRRRGVIAGR